jgi:hypothetical protein
MSDTPRTDDHTVPAWYVPKNEYVVHVNHARQLERKLNEVERQKYIYKDEVKRLGLKCAKVERELSEANKKVMKPEDLKIGDWLSAALSDPKVCAEFKTDIEAWFDSFETTEPPEE